jgi:hypothetical protein
MGHLEPNELVEEGNLIPDELQELVRIPDVLACGPGGGHLDALIERLESLLAMGAPEFGQTALD